MLSNYKNQCIKLANEALESKTRYTFDFKDLPNYKDFEFEFEVKVINNLSVNTFKTTHFGTGFLDKYSEIFENQKQCYEASIEQENNEKKNLEHLKYLYNEINANGYGYFLKTSTLYTIKKKFLYEYVCSICKSYGKIECSKCRGSGEVKCKNCSRGEIKCPKCYGRGRLQKSRNVKRGNSTTTQTYYVDCDRCRGTKKIECSTCRGTAVVTCSKCGGDGEVTCQNCEGKGYLTDILTTHIIQNPNYEIQYDSQKQDLGYEKQAISKIPIENLQKYGVVQRISIIQDKNAQTITEIYKVQVPFASFDIMINDNSFQWIVYGLNPEVFDLGNTLEFLLQADMLDLCKVARKVSWKPFYIFYSSKTIKNFVESEINQKLLNGEHINKSLNELDEELSSSKLSTEEYMDKTEPLRTQSVNSELSEEYINKSIAAMNEITRGYCLRSNLFWFVLATLCSLIFSKSIGDFFHQNSISILFFSDFNQFYQFIIVPIIFLVGAILGKIWRVFIIKKAWGNFIYFWMKNNSIDQFQKLFWLFLIFGTLEVFLIKKFLLNVD